MRLQELVEKIPYRLAKNAPNGCLFHDIRHVTTDAAKATCDSIYVCTATALREGHTLAAAAYGRGCRHFLARRMPGLPDDAVVLIVEDPNAYAGELAARCLQHPARYMTVIGVTGTYGKTGTVQLLASILRQNGRAVSTLTTDGIDAMGVVSPAGRIVPDAVSLQEILHQFREAGTDIALLELSSYMLKQKTHLGVPFFATLFTGVSPHHIGPREHADWEEYCAAKLSLLEQRAPFVIAPTQMQICDRLHGARLLTVGDGGDACAKNLQLFAEDGVFGTSFSLHICGNAVPIRLPLPGGDMVQNAVLAALGATVLGLAPTAIAAGLATASTPGRLALAWSDGERHIFQDSAYTAEDLTRALRTLRTYTTGRLTVLVGSVGGRAKERRAPLGKAATDWADYTYFTADDPNFENVTEICKQMAADVTDPARYCIVTDRTRAIHQAVLQLRRGDTLLLAGKGAVPGQLVCGNDIPFSELSCIKDAVHDL